MNAFAEPNNDEVKIYCGNGIVCRADKQTGVAVFSGSGKFWESEEDVPDDFEYDPFNNEMICCDNFRFTWLKKVVFTGGINYIPEDYFYKCESLTGVELSPSIRKICDNAFELCWNLSEVYIPNGLEEICSYAFYGTYLKDLVLPASVKKIGINAITRYFYLEETSTITIYNPNCKIYSFDDFDIVYGYRNSTAQKYVYQEAVRLRFGSYGPIARFVPFDAENCTVKGHHYESYIEDEATCTGNGCTANICTECGELKFDYPPALGHSFEKNKKYCLNGCGKENPDYEPDEHEHSYASRIITSPTCTNDGFCEYYCIYCGKSYEQIIKKSGHRYEEVSFSPGSCYVQMRREVFCDVCRNNKVISSMYLHEA